MKALAASFIMFLRHISRDGMLVGLGVAPVLMLIVMYYIVPTFVAPSLPFDIGNYYLLLDLMVAVMTPLLLCFASALAILDEIDGNITPYISVTPVGRCGYIVSRLVLPTIVASIITMLFLGTWSLTNLSTPMVIAISISVALLTMIAAMVVVSFAKNKVEGMALSKASGLLMVGLFIPFFMDGNIQYLFGFLPSFWTAKLALTTNYTYLLPLTACSGIWIAILIRVYKLYKRRLL